MCFESPHRVFDKTNKQPQKSVNDNTDLWELLTLSSLKQSSHGLLILKHIKLSDDMVANYYDECIDASDSLLQRKSQAYFNGSTVTPDERHSVSRHCRGRSKCIRTNRINKNTDTSMDFPPTRIVGVIPEIDEWPKFKIGAECYCAS